MFQASCSISAEKRQDLFKELPATDAVISKKHVCSVCLYLDLKVTSEQIALKTDNDNSYLINVPYNWK